MDNSLLPTAEQLKEIWDKQNLEMSQEERLKRDVILLENQVKINDLAIQAIEAIQKNPKESKDSLKLLIAEGVRQRGSWCIPNGTLTRSANSLLFPDNEEELLSSFGRFVLAGESLEYLIAALGTVGGKDSEFEIYLLLADELNRMNTAEFDDVKIREQLIQALGFLGGEYAVKGLNLAIEKDIPRLSSGAAYLLENIKNPNRNDYWD